MSTDAATRAATPELVRQLVREVRDQVRGRSHPQPLAIGVRARPVWTHGSLTAPDNSRITVEPCPTPLAVRRAIAEFVANTDDGAATLVLLTDLPEAQLGNDVLARLVRPRLLSMSAWDAVRQRFGVRRLDPAYAEPRYSWMADALLAVPVDAVPPGVGMLSVEAGLDAVARDVLGTTGTSLERLLVASAQAGFAAKVELADRRTVEQLCTTLGQVLGPAGQLVAGAIAHGHGERALPAGLAARTLAGGISGAFAQAKVADLTGVVLATDAALEAWARAAELAFEELAASDLPVALDVALAGSALVQEWQAPFPAKSNILAASFDARLEQLAERLAALLDGPDDADTTSLREAVAAVNRHREATTQLGRSRAQRAQLAARLVAWLRDPVSRRHGTGVTHDAVPLALQASIDAYASDGAWVDAARRRVGEGDDTPEAFAGVLRRIGEAAHAQRASGNRAFADALARWTVDGTARELAPSSVVAVESVLADVVAPLAAQVPVLLVVLDGCGLPQFLELADQFRQLGFREVGAGDDGHRRAGLAAFPTVTGVSRTALLTGLLQNGTAADESRGLPTHPAVAKLPGPPAVLLHHHTDLVGGVGQHLPGPVLDALGADGPRLVAAVVNTIDDELMRGTYTPEYRIENLGPLHALLRAAASAGRAVIITSDHGHVLGVGLDGRGDVARAGEGGDRWRVADRAPSDDEVLLRGPRVLLGDDRGVLAPWHDDLRYSAKRGGYHGGATPDECIVPLSVFVPVGVDTPKGWAPVAVVTPAWWDLQLESVAAPEVSPPPKPTRRTPVRDHPELFPSESTTGAGEVPARPATPRPPSTVPWLDPLLASDLYAVQLGAIGRAKPPEDRIRAALAVLHARGGVASFAVIAQATGMPPARVSGFLAILTRLLNVDGYGVLTLDQNAQEARLDEQLLRTQFLSEATS